MLNENYLNDRESHILLDISTEIQKAVISLFNLEPVIDKLCHSVQDEFKYDYCAIQLTRHEENIIETIHGSGETGVALSGLAKHSLEKNQKLQDIQAYVALTGNTVMVRGWHPMFDRWIYDTFHHNELSRIFTPIELAFDENSKLIKDWYKNRSWKEIDRKQELAKKEEGYRDRVFLAIKGVVAEHINHRIIGTVEGGYQDRQKEISDKEAQALNEFVAERAPALYKTLLDSVLRVIVCQARQHLKADSVAIHFPNKPKYARYAYEIIEGQKDPGFLPCFQQNQDRPSHEAGNEKRLLIKENISEGSWLDQKIRATAAFPILVQNENEEGVLSINHHRSHRFAENEITWGHYFARWSENAINISRQYSQARDRVKQLAMLHSTAVSLSKIPQDPDLLKHLAWSTLNLLAADIVTIYEYSQLDKNFKIPPERAGKLIVTSEMDAEIHKGDAPDLLLRHGTNVFAVNVINNEILNSKTRKPPGIGQKNFVRRENIKSAAGVILRAGQEIVGEMFINFRRLHHFHRDEKDFIQELSDSAAIAIKNRRLFEKLMDINQEIITTLESEKLMNLLVAYAMELTEADLCEIRLLDPLTETLVLKAEHVAGKITRQNPQQIGMNEGVTGWVANHGTSILVTDVNKCDFYKACHPDVGSELCVPLLRKDKKSVLGVLNVESRKRSAFSSRHQSVLEKLAENAALALENAERKNMLCAIEKTKTLGDLAIPLVHWMYNQISVLQYYAQKIKDSGINLDRVQITAADEILRISQQTSDEAQKLTKCTYDSYGAVDLSQIIRDAVSQVIIPEKIEFPNKESNEAFPQVIGNAQQLTYIFANLLINAVTAIPKSKITVDGHKFTDKGKEWVVINVEDDGVGITEKQLEILCQPGHSSTGGLGLGLWWTEIYVENLGGQIKINSTLGEGTRVSVILPVAYKKTE